MKLDHIHIEGYKSFAAVNVSLGALNVLVGANGAGKSNFLSVFKLLRELVSGRLQLFVRHEGGASALLHHGPKHTQRIKLSLDFGRNAYAVTFFATVDDSLAFYSEDTYFQGERYGTPYVQHIGSGHTESKLLTYSETASVARHVLAVLKTWQLYHFHDTGDTAGVKLFAAGNDTEYLRSDASNLAPFLAEMQRTAPGNYAAIRSAIRQVAPFFDDFVLRPLADNPERMRLEWRQASSDYPLLAHQLSDGTLRYMCLAAALLQPTPPATILIDEPELGLHPYALHQLGALIRSASSRVQIILGTQSVTLLESFQPDELIVVDRTNGTSDLSRLSPDLLATWLQRYSLGELWEKNVFGGRPTASS